MKITDVLAPIGRVQHLSAADRGQVAVALVTDDNVLGTAAFGRGGDRRRAAVRSLNIAHIEVVIREDGAAHRADQNHAVLDTELVDRMCQKFVRDSVAAARAVVCLVLHLGFALVAAIECLRLPVCDSVFRHKPSPAGLPA